MKLDLALIFITQRNFGIPYQLFSVLKPKYTTATAHPSRERNTYIGILGVISQAFNVSDTMYFSLPALISFIRMLAIVFAERGRAAAGRPTIQTRQRY